jgi:hypothetical protein
MRTLGRRAQAGRTASVPHSGYLPASGHVWTTLPSTVDSLIRRISAALNSATESAAELSGLDRIPIGQSNFRSRSDVQAGPVLPGNQVLPPVCAHAMQTCGYSLDPGTWTWQPRGADEGTGGHGSTSNTGVDDDERQAPQAEGLDPDDPAVLAAIDLVRWELSLAT